MFLVVYGSEDTIDGDVEVDDEEEPVARTEESITPTTNEILVREKEMLRI